jgi:hypothetical protein
MGLTGSSEEVGVCPLALRIQPVHSVVAMGCIFIPLPSPVLPGTRALPRHYGGGAGQEGKPGDRAPEGDPCQEGNNTGHSSPPLQSGPQSSPPHPFPSQHRWSW